VTITDILLSILIIIGFINSAFVAMAVMELRHIADKREKKRSELFRREWL
jgi:hypothetical protein